MNMKKAASCTTDRHGQCYYKNDYRNNLGWNQGDDDFVFNSVCVQVS